MGEHLPIKLGIAGIGRAGWGMHCQELQGRERLFSIVAACDVIAERCALMVATYGCRTYTTIEELLADPEVEMVDIATRSCDHFAHAKSALDAGKDVFLEKPICVTFEDAVRLQEIAANSPGSLYVRHNRRFEPAFQHIREIIASGRLGEVYEIQLRRVGYQRRGDWQTLLEYGGGQLLNWGPHIIDHALRLLESPVYHVWSDLQRIAAVGDAEDHVKIILTGENGRIVDLEISGGAAIGAPEYLIWGTQGALQCTGDTITLRYLDPTHLLTVRTADAGTPGAGQVIPVPNHLQRKETDQKSAASFGTLEHLAWVEETIRARPSTSCEMPSIWDLLFRAVREGAPFPITIEEAVDVMAVILCVKAGTRFDTVATELENETTSRVFHTACPCRNEPSPDRSHLSASAISPWS